MLTDEPLVRCPMRTIQLASERRDPIAAEVERYAGTYYPAYKAGHRLTDGGIGDQPSRYLELIGVFREVESQIEAKLIEIMKRETPLNE